LFNFIIFTWKESKYTKNLSVKFIPKIFIVYDTGTFLKNKNKVEAISAYGPEGITAFIFNACATITYIVSKVEDKIPTLIK